MYYFTDPMCSWCYGFSPTVKKLKENYSGIDLEIISGGFSPGSTQVVDQQYRNFLEYHWNNVTQMSGQPFDHAMKFVSDSFRYDTEPSSRALVTVKKLAPDHDFEYLSLMQKAFYVYGKDITKDAVLAGLAEEIGVKKDLFLESFSSEELKLKTQQGFEFSRQLGVQGFPTLLTLDEGKVKLITRGYQDFDSLSLSLDNFLQSRNRVQVDKGLSCNDGTCEVGN